MINGSRKSFHAHRQVRIPTVAFMGPSRGNTMRQNVVHALAPSTAAASSSSLGRDCRYPTYTKMLKPRPYTTYRKISPPWLSRCSVEVCFTTGSMMIENGTKRADTK